MAPCPICDNIGNTLSTMEEHFDRVPGQSMDIEMADIEKFRAVFPQCFSEGKIDIGKLLALFGQYEDNDFEKYKFEWKGKSECYKIAGKRSTGTLRPYPEDSVNFDTTKNLYIEGDNLEVLKLLQTSYYRKVKMIYIDPPYNTGHDFIYQDDFNYPISRYKEVTQQTTKSNPETMGRYHTNWLNMMYPRLRLAANLLRDDGVIFISIDDNEVTNLKKICDEVFGEENFIGNIVIKSNPRGSQSVESLAKQHEYLLVYAKILNNAGIVGHALSDDMLNEYCNEDTRGRYRLLGLRQRGGFWRRSERPLLYYPIYVNPETEAISLDSNNGYTYKVIPYQPSTGEDGTWRWSKEKFLNETDSLIAKKIIRDGKSEWDIFQKDYLCKDGQTPKRTKTKSLWDEKEMNYQNGSIEINKLFGSTGMFSFPKPLNLVKKCIQMISLGEYDIVLDFFSGSSTTAHAVMQLNAEDGGNRQFIMVQLPELCDEKSEAFKAGYRNICEIGKERIRRAGAKIHKQNNAVDVGFKCLKLDTSNLVKWDSTPTQNVEELTQRMALMSETVKPDRSELDIIYEVMLKLGIPLDREIVAGHVNGKRVYAVKDDSDTLICLDQGSEGITAEDLSEMCDELTPKRLVLAEQAFKDDIALSNAHYILRDKGIEIKIL